MTLFKIWSILKNFLKYIKYFKLESLVDPVFTLCFLTSIFYVFNRLKLFKIPEQKFLKIAVPVHDAFNRLNPFKKLLD